MSISTRCPIGSGARFGEPLLAGKLAKLALTGRPEQHLFVRVHQSGMPFGLFDPLCWTAVVPTMPLREHGALTGLWIAGRWASGVLRWTAEGGWDRVPFDPL